MNNTLESKLDSSKTFRMKSITLALVIICVQSLYSQTDDENKSLFKLGSTPFINKSKYSLNLSYGVNYGSPSFIVQQWMLPNDKRSIMFDNITGSISIGNKIEAFVSYIDGYSLAYNESYLGVDFKVDEYIYGFKWKVIDSENYIPDASIEINSTYPISLSLGSSAESFKYYFCMDWGWGLSYIPLPYRFSIGAAYSIIDNLNLFAEGNYEIYFDGQIPYQTARTGAELSLYNYIHLDIALFYFGFKFTEIIPGRGGLTWQNPDYIMTMPEKNNYFLLSSSIFISLDLLK